MAADQRQSIPDVRAVNPCSRNHLAGGRAGSPRDAGTQLSLSPRARDRAIKEDFDVDSTLQSRKRVGRHGAWGRGLGYVLRWKKKELGGRNIADSLISPLEVFVKPGPTKKISDSWALHERVGINFLVENYFNCFRFL